MADTPRVQLRCDGCGQTDDHPKMHYGAQTYHHDCIPAFVLDDLTSESFFRVEGTTVLLESRVPLPEEKLAPQIRRLLAVREMAMKGTRGPKLLSRITEMPPAEEEFPTPKSHNSPDEEN
jgi:hypothetical protein